MASKLTVVIASRYWQFVCFDAAGQRRVDVIESAKAFFDFQVVASSPSTRSVIGHTTATRSTESVGEQVLSDPVIQRQLWEMIQGSPTNTMTDDALLAGLCLRCCISNVIDQVCSQLAQQFGTTHGFTTADLLPLVLDTRPYSKRLKEIAIVQQREGQYESLTSRILRTYSPSQGSLTTWTIQLVRRDRTLNQFLLEQGVYLISDWAILNDSTPQQVEQVLLEFHQLTPYESQAASQLLRCYHAVYRRDRRLNHAARKRCYEPTLLQLGRIGKLLQTIDVSLSRTLSSEGQILERLKILASQLREYRIYRRGGTPRIHSTDDVKYRINGLMMVAPSAKSTEEEQDHFLEQFRAQVLNSLDDAIDGVIASNISQLKRRRNNQSQHYIEGLYRFHCSGESMGTMAPVLGLKAQYQVSRLLNLKTLRTDIRQRMLESLGDRVRKQAQPYLSLAQLKDLDLQLDQILTEQVDQLFADAAVEASTNTACVFKSLYANRLCHYLRGKWNQ